MAGTLEQLQSLVKALEAGNYASAPQNLVQGGALQTEDLSPVMNNVTFSDEHLKLQKMFKVSTVKSTLAQFDRQLSYGILGGSAQIEGAIGSDETSEYVRVVVPMCYYSHVRRVTMVANMVSTVDGKKAEDRAAADAAKKLAADIEFDLFRGKGDFINSNGVFDGNPLTVATGPNMHGLEIQIRQSDSQRNAHDLMFGEFGSDETIVINGGGVLQQAQVEDACVRSAMNFGSADRLIIDPITLSAYNKTMLGDKYRVVLAGSPQDAGGSDFRRQWTSGGTVQIEASRFLSGKTRGAQPRRDGPTQPTISAVAYLAGTTAFKLNEVYTYYVTACNEVGEGPRSAVGTATVDADKKAVRLTIINGGVVRFYNVYRGAVGITDTALFKFVGRVAADPSGTTYFVDAGNKVPGFVTGYLMQGDTCEVKELSPYSRLKLAVVDLSVPEAHFRFLTLAVTQPRKNVIIDNLSR